ncbi:MAG: hypothetical protein NZ874_03140 [Fimbriimonadales bacterium]|nr:hypothetical protein [Fimbriimonadales bacterium]
MYPTAKRYSVRGWLIGLGLILLLNAIAVGYWHYDDGLYESFENGDTRTILQRLQQPHSAWEWFIGDWVLGNGFYRPLPSVLYQIDYSLWGADLLAWKWANGLLAVLNALLVVVFGWALSGRRDFALISGLIFSFWQTGLLPAPPSWLAWVGLAAGVLRGWLMGNLRQGILWGSVAFTLVLELGFIPMQWDLHQQSFAYRAVGWIPGRTATLMTLFALIALTGACLYARTGKARWAVAGLSGFVGALLSYEQAVALPILIGLAAWAAASTRPLASERQEPNQQMPSGKATATARGKNNSLRRALILSLLCLILLAPYTAFYHARIPVHTDYHQQRLRRFRTIPETTLNWLVPPATKVGILWDVVPTAPLLLLFPSFWGAHMGLAAYLVALWVGLRARQGWLGWLGALIAYAPLMPVMPLMHYYYLPAVFRASWAGILLLCLLTLRPTRRVISDATAVGMCLKRSSPRSMS